MNKSEFLLDTVIHKKLILEAGEKMIKYLLDNNRKKDATLLSKRLIIHDNSKIKNSELKNFVKIKDKDNLKNPDVLLSKAEQAMIKAHWKNNRHHPEHFKDYHDMSEIDIMEMVCDWYSRSIQYKTDFISFVKKRQKNRFKFDKPFYNKVIKYCEIISEGD